MRRCLVAAAALLLVAACSRGPDESSSTSPASGSGAPAPDGPAAAVAAAEVPARPSTGCGAATAGVAPGQSEVATTSGGVARSYLRYVPARYDATMPVPLVVDLHGYSEGAKIHAALSGLGPFGDAHGFVTITPQATGVVPFWDTAAGSPDQAFVATVLDEVGAALCIDTARVFATGLSNGAMMTSALACAFADRFAAVGAVAGVSDPPECRPARPVPIVAIHGTLDQFLAYDGGFGPAVAKLPAPDGSGRTLGDLASGGTGVAGGAARPSVPAVAAAWAGRDGCATTPTESAVAADVARLRFPCPPGVDVEVYRVDGGGHTWPGSKVAASVAGIVGFTTFSIDANQVLWDFFQAHPLRARAGG